MAATGLWLRYDFLLVPLLLAVVLPVLGAWRRDLGVWPLSALVLGFGIAVLTGMWSSGISDGYVIGGIVPHNDAKYFVTGALRLLHEGELTAWASRRPVFPSLLALLLSVSGHHLTAALWVFLILNCVAIVLGTRAVQTTHGGVVAGIVLAGLLLFYRRYIGVALSENVGFLLGCLGFILLWLAASNARRTLFCAGLFLLALGLNARAGAFFVLPALVLWGSWRFRGDRPMSTSVLVNGALAVVAAFSLNLYLLHVVGHPEMGLSNFFYGLYGLLHGGSWDLVLERYPDLRLLSEADRTAAIAQVALQDLRQNPALLARGIARAYGAFFFDPVNSAFSFIRITGPGANDLAVAYGAGGVGGALRTIAARPFSHLNELMLAGLMLVLNLFALLALVRFRMLSADSRYPMVLAAWLGILMSVPFAPPWDASMMRAYAATVPFMIALPALGFSSLRRRARSPPAIPERSAHALARVTLALGLGTTVVALVTPAVSARSAAADVGGPAVAAGGACPEGTSLRAVRFLPVDSTFRLTGAALPASKWSGRELSVARFREGLRLLSRRSGPLQADLAAVPEGAVVASVYESGRQVAPILALDEDRPVSGVQVQLLCMAPSETALHRAFEPEAPAPGR